MISQEKIEFCNPTQEDLSEIISLLADDVIGKQTEQLAHGLESVYLKAFQEIMRDENNELIVGKRGKQVVAVLQVTYIPNLTLRGSKRALIEGVRVTSQLRGQGVGRQLFEFVLNRARQRGCKLVQLTAHKSRTEAHRFYKTLGFQATHEGFKLTL